MDSINIIISIVIGIGVIGIIFLIFNMISKSNNKKSLL